MTSLHVSYQGDATETEAIDKQKVHIGKTGTTSIVQADIESSLHQDCVINIEVHVGPFN